MNDIQKHLLAKVGQAADDYRAHCRALAADVVDSILGGIDAGLTREQVIEDLAAGFVSGGLR